MNFCLFLQELFHPFCPLSILIYPYYYIMLIHAQLYNNLYGSERNVEIWISTSTWNTIAPLSDMWLYVWSVIVYPSCASVVILYYLLYEVSDGLSAMLAGSFWSEHLISALNNLSKVTDDYSFLTSLTVSPSLALPMRTQRCTIRKQRSRLAYSLLALISNHIQSPNLHTLPWIISSQVLT